MVSTGAGAEERDYLAALESRIREKDADLDALVDLLAKKDYEIFQLKDALIELARNQPCKDEIVA